MPVRIRAHPMGYPLKPPVQPEELASHKSTHATGGADALTPADIGAARPATLIVAASNSSAKGKAAADYVCDGVSDQVEINTALSALGTTGGRVLLLEGTYIVDGPINVPSNVSLVGQGPGTVIKIKDALDADINVVQNVDQTQGNTKIVLRDFAIDGNKAQNTLGYQRGVYFYEVTYSLIINLWVTNCKHHGIFLDSCSNNTVTGNNCQGNNGNGIYLSSSSNNTVTGNTCQGNSYYGIYLSSSSNNTVTGNTCQENSQWANATYDNIQIDYNSDYNNVQANTCRQGALANKPRYGICIKSADCDGNLVTNNDCYSSGATAGISNAGTGTNFGGGNRVNNGTWSTTPS